MDIKETNRNYTISKDPEEWKFVEQALPPLTVPIPKPKEEYPSDWKPQAENLKDKPYYVGRTRNHMLPVYLEKKFRGTKQTTHVRLIKGDIWLLHDQLVKFLQPESKFRIQSQVNEFAGFLRFKGDFVNAIKYWLTKHNL